VKKREKVSSKTRKKRAEKDDILKKAHSWKNGI